MFIFTHDKKIYWSPSIDMSQEEFEIIGEMDEESLKEIDSAIRHIYGYKNNKPDDEQPDDEQPDDTVTYYDIIIYIVYKWEDLPYNTNPNMNPKKWSGTSIDSFRISYTDYVEIYKRQEQDYIRALKKFIKKNNIAIIWKEGANADVSSYRKIMKIFSTNKTYSILIEGVQVEAHAQIAAEEYAKELEKQKH